MRELQVRKGRVNAMFVSRTTLIFSLFASLLLNVLFLFEQRITIASIEQVESCVCSTSSRMTAQGPFPEASLIENKATSDIAHPVTAIEDTASIWRNNSTNSSGPMNRDLDLVIALYSPSDNFTLMVQAFNNQTLQGKTYKWFIYNKNPDIQPSAPLFNILQGEHEVVSLPNYGRESQTFLHHIYNKYNDLAAQTMFCQESPPRRIFRRMLRALQAPNLGFLRLGPASVCTCETQKCGRYFIYGLREVSLIVHRKWCQGVFAASLKGCFVVSRKRIHSRPRSVYGTLKQLIEVVNPEYMLGFPVNYDTKFLFGHRKNQSWSLSNPYLGHTFERSWSMIFQCNGSACLDEYIAPDFEETLDVVMNSKALNLTNYIPEGA